MTPLSLTGDCLAHRRTTSAFTFTDARVKETVGPAAERGMILLASRHIVGLEQGDRL